MFEYKFCPLCGTGLGEIVEEGTTFPHCHGCKKFTHYDNPKGVSVLLIPTDGGIVFVKRKVAPRAGKFALPAGFINKGEGPRQAGTREGLEETGLIVEIVRTLAELPVPGGNQFLIFYEAKVVGGELKAGSDALEVGVYPFDALPSEIAFPLHDQVIKDWIAARAATLSTSASSSPTPLPAASK